MSSLLEKIEAIEKIGAGDLVDQTLQKWIHLHLQKYERHMSEIQAELEPFEKQFGLDSAEGHKQYESGDLGDNADVVEWMGLYENVLLYQERIETLRAVATK